MFFIEIKMPFYCIFRVKSIVRNSSGSEVSYCFIENKSNKKYLSIFVLVCFILKCKRLSIVFSELNQLSGIAAVLRFPIADPDEEGDSEED